MRLVTNYIMLIKYRSEAYGRVLALDGIIQCTSRDEFSYQEMITHLPLFSHPCPKSVSNYIALKIINLLLPEHGVSFNFFFFAKLKDVCIF